MAYDLRNGIIETANALGMSPQTLATIISYESGFNPGVWGGAGGNHYGLIQFGPSERSTYGVTVGDPASQLGPEGAIAKYFRDRGWKPDMGMLDAYSIVNAGGPGLYSASDQNNGGMRGSVYDKVTQQFAPHEAKARAFLGDIAQQTAATPNATTSPQRPNDQVPQGGLGGIHVRHPPNPGVGTPGQNWKQGEQFGPPIPAKAPATKGDLWAAFGKGMSGMGGGDANFDYRVPSQPAAVLSAEGATPMIDPNAAQMQRQQLAAAMAQLRRPLWG